MNDYLTAALHARQAILTLLGGHTDPAHLDPEAPENGGLDGTLRDLRGRWGDTNPRPALLFFGG